jgi:outer membrane lipoprotein carrier protein
MTASMIVLGCATALAAFIPAQTKPAKPAGAEKRATAADPAVALLGKVQKYYDTTKDYSADFVQVYTRVALSQTSESSGRLMIRKPGMMRWEYKKPAEKLFVTDGSKLFVYDVEEGEVIVDPSFRSADLSSSLSFLWGEGKLVDSFQATVVEPEKHQAPKASNVLELIPKKDATYTKLVLVLDPKTSQVTESILFETSGNTNRFKFKNPVINSGLAPDQFKFVPPPGVEVTHRP